MDKKTVPGSQYGGENGALPSSAPLAVPYVPYQQNNPPRYDSQDALNNGTLFPGLNLPFRLKTEAGAVVNTPLAELQALGFVLDELGLYLDTHSDDEDALALYKTYAALEKEGRETYVKRCGPLEQTDVVNFDSYTWLNDPWPWEGGTR